jgi:hypothetical protein
MDDVPLRATPLDPDALLEPLAPIDLAQRMQRARSESVRHNAAVSYLRCTFLNQNLYWHSIYKANFKAMAKACCSFIRTSLRAFGHRSNPMADVHLSPPSKG